LKCGGGVQKGPTARKKPHREQTGGKERKGNIGRRVSNNKPKKKKQLNVVNWGKIKRM